MKLKIWVAGTAALSLVLITGFAATWSFAAAQYSETEKAMARVVEKLQSYDNFFFPCNGKHTFSTRNRADKFCTDVTFSDMIDDLNLILRTKNSSFEAHKSEIRKARKDLYLMPKICLESKGPYGLDYDIECPRRFTRSALGILQNL